MKKLIIGLSTLIFCSTLQSMDYYNRLPGLESDLLKAVESGNLEKVKNALSRFGRPDVNVRDSSGATALFIAEMKGYNGIAEELKKNGASPDLFIVLPKDQTNPRVTIQNPPHSRLMDMLYINWKLIDAMKEVSSEISKRINEKDQSGHTALMQAAGYHQIMLVDLLLANGAKVNEKDNEGHTALIYACYTDGEEGLMVIKSLIKAGADLNVVDKDGDTPLTIAIKFQHEDMAKMLRRAGAVLRDDMEDSIKDRIYKRFENES